MLRHELTKIYLHEILQYEKHTGKFFWNKRGPGRSLKKEAGSFDSYGYRRININGIYYKAHRLAWFYVYGEWPKSQIDHINQIKSDNRFENLRVVTISENLQNRSLQKNNTSGFKGVSWKKSRKKWQAMIKINGNQTHLGYFDEIEDAYKAYLFAASVKHTNNPLVKSFVADK